ncbi:MAG TPA: phosphoribosyltransferase family protein [Pseudonocardiaceae bacterium]|nr:phosphoribosyltransferase family protein [Pseudonocardiaceae bacterium]
MDSDHVRDVFEACGAVRRGHFRVPAGQHTAEFWEKFAVLQDPVLADDLFGRLAAVLAPLSPTVIAGPTQGGLIVAWGVARHLGCRAAFLERDYRPGPFVLRRGSRLSEADDVVLVDDLVSSGTTVYQSVQALHSLGARVAGIGCLIDRRMTVPADEVRMLPALRALLTLDGPPNYQPGSCPLCAAGVPLQDPRSLRAL